MRTLLTIAAAVLAIGISETRAQVPLTAYVDANGYIDVQKLTCAQLADTFQPDADALMAWYSGWYNGLAHKHFLDYRKGKVVEHEVIVYCKEHPDRRIIDAIAVVFRDERAALGAEMRPMRPEQFAAAPAQAVPQNGTIHVNVISAGFIVGAGGGEGTLTFDGQVYPITVGGIGIGVIGFAGGEVEGVAYNLRSPADIAGNYGAAGAGFTVIGGARVAQLQNENGVIIQVHGVQIGLEVNLNLAGMTIALK
jgi:HdeA/HdeB family